jgi:hypothetical protein
LAANDPLGVSQDVANKIAVDPAVGCRARLDGTLYNLITKGAGSLSAAKELERVNRVETRDEVVQMLHSISFHASPPHDGVQQRLLKCLWADFLPPDPAIPGDLTRLQCIRL